MISLRPYQVEMIEQVRQKMRAGCKSVLLQSPTGSGKTVLAAKMLETATSKEMRSFFLIHRRELTKQSIRTFVDVGVRHGVIAAGFGEDKSQNVQIASVQTLARRYHNVIPPDFIIWDEAHHVAAGTWDKIYKAFPNTFHIGLTATPERLDGKGLKPWFDDIVYGPPVRWLIDQGYLSDYKIFAPTTIDTDGLRISGGDFNKKELREALRKKPQIVGDAVREYKKYANGLPTIFFNVSVEASENLVSQLKAAGITAAHVDGKTEKTLRDLEIRKFKNGETDTLSNVDLFGEGFDVPGISAISMLRPTNSLGLYLQQVGRALRPVYADGFDLSTQEGRLESIAAGAKPYAIILDHAGNVERHGLPDQERQWSLYGKKARMKLESDGPGVKICPRCFAAQKSGPPKCTHCGFLFPINPREYEHVEGDLQELDIKELKKQQVRERKVEQSKAHTLEELYELGVQRKMKNPRGWSQHVFNARQRQKLGR